MDIAEVIAWIAKQGGKHVEIVPRLGFDIEEPGLIERIREQADACGIEISNYAVDGSFIGEGEGELEAQIQKTLRHVDIAYQLGAKRMRHDVAWRPPAETTIMRFEQDLETIVPACRTIADYAARFGIATSVENHGYHVQASDRVLRLLHEVERDNFKVTLDIGNFMCVDEDPLAAVKKLIPHASIVHLKDFYLRPENRDPGAGFFKTTAGRYLRGAILGHGDIKLSEVLQVVRDSGYQGYASVEFEGMEDCLEATRIGLDNARRLWERTVVNG